MPVYTLYPQAPDGTSKTFRAYELPSDEAATELASKVLNEHESAEAVAVWREDVFVGLVKTEAAAQRDLMASSA